MKRSLSSLHVHFSQLNEIRGCFTNTSQALKNNPTKIYNARNHIKGENFKLKLCTCAQSTALGTHASFQLWIRIRGMISAIQKFQRTFRRAHKMLVKHPLDQSICVLTPKANIRFYRLALIKENCDKLVNLPHKVIFIVACCKHIKNIFSTKECINFYKFSS